MRNILLATLAVIVVVVVLVLVLRPGGEGEQEPGTVALGFEVLYREAAGAVSPDSLGRPWPDKPALTAMRAEWGALGFRDSTVMEELMREWVYPAGGEPSRLTSMRRTPTGRNLGLVTRLKLGQQMLAHPHWRLGAMRHYPVLAAVLDPVEKAVLAFLSGTKNRRMPATAVAKGVDLPVETVEPALASLVEVGWMTAQGPADSTAYRLANTSLAGSPALQFVTIEGAGAGDREFPTLRSAFSGSVRGSEGLVTVRSPCMQSGRMISLSALGGKLRRGRPGNAWGADVLTPGSSTGLFMSEAAFNAWRETHEAVEIGFQGTVVATVRHFLEDTDGS